MRLCLLKSLLAGEIAQAPKTTKCASDATLCQSAGPNDRLWLVIIVPTYSPIYLPTRTRRWLRRFELMGHQLHPPCHNYQVVVESR